MYSWEGSELHATNKQAIAVKIMSLFMLAIFYKCNKFSLETIIFADMKRILLLLFPIILSCSQSQTAYTDIRQSVEWQQDQWNMSARAARDLLDTKGKETALRCMDAAVAAMFKSDKEWADGQEWDYSVTDGAGKARLIISRGEEKLLFGREEHRTGCEVVVTDRYLSLPTDVTLTVELAGAEQGRFSLEVTGQDVNGNGELDQEDQLHLSVGTHVADFTFSLSPATLDHGELAATLAFMAGDNPIFEINLESRGLEMQKELQHSGSEYWDESYTFYEWSFKARELLLEAHLIGGIHILGSVEEKKVQEALSALPDFPSEAQATSATATASEGVHLTVYYEDDLQTPRSTLFLSPVHILNLYDDYWTWEAAVNVMGNYTTSVNGFFSIHAFDNLIMESQSFIDSWKSLLPHLLD